MDSTGLVSFGEYVRIAFEPASTDQIIDAMQRAAERLQRPWGIGVYGKELLGIAPDREAVLCKADLVLACSNFSKNLAVEKGVREAGTRVVHPPVDTDIFTPAEDHEAIKRRFGLRGREVLLTVAHLVPRKGHEQVIRALPAIQPMFPNVVYLVVGRGPHESQLRSVTQELGLEDCVRFCGYVPDSDLPFYYRAADVHLMPSLNEGDVEGFGISFVEAAACATPSIGSRSGGIPDAISEGETGYLAEPADVGGLADGILRLLGDEELRQRMGDLARTTALANFSLSSFARSLRSAFGELPIAGHKRDPQ